MNKKISLLKSKSRTLTLKTVLDSSNRPGEEESIKYTMPSIIGKYVFHILLPVVRIYLLDRGNNA